jgi:hypothetical protein
MPQSALELLVLLRWRRIGVEFRFHALIITIRKEARMNVCIQKPIISDQYLASAMPQSETRCKNMSSQGRGSDISLQDSIDLLHKLMTEETKVVAILHVAPRLGATVFGTVKFAPDGTFWVKDLGGIPHVIVFDPHLAERRTYGDSRTMSPIPKDFTPALPRVFDSALCFTFPGEGSLCLFAAPEES